MSGKRRRLARILRPDATVWLPLDDSLVSGPRAGLRDIGTLLDQPLITHIDGLLCYRGLAKHFAGQVVGLPLIENLSASTIRSRHVDKAVVGCVEGAIRRGADSIAYHFNFTDASEHESLRELGRLSERAEEFGMPLTVIAYPRRTSADNTDDNYETLRDSSPYEFAELVSHAVRVAVELGADVVKTTYTGTVDSFRAVVAAAYGVPVMVGGGPLPPDQNDAARLAHDVVAAGARGICFGRRVFDSVDPLATLRGIRAAMEAPI